MSIKILTKNSIDNTNIDGARQNHFSAGMKSGIVKGSLNEGRFFASASNIITLDTCVLLISGHEIVIDSVQYITLSNKPATPTRYSMIAEISVNDNSEPTFRLFIQASETALIQQNLFNTQNGAGTYQIKIGNFTLDTNGEIQEINRIVDVISGGGDGASADIEFNASAETISSNLQPEVNVDYNEETKKYDMLIKIPSGTGSKVLVGGVVQDEWDADIVNENTNKIEQLETYNTTNAPTLAFAESERQKSLGTDGAIVHANEVYPVGSIYMSVNQTSPASFFGGTWEQLTADAYLKIVTSNGGSLGGTSSEHKIPVSSMPAHRHSLQLASTSGGDWSYVLNSASVDKNKSAELSGGFTGSTDMRGGGEAYYPYYYGVYVWKRVG